MLLQKKAWRRRHGHVELSDDLDTVGKILGRLALNQLLRHMICSPNSVPLQSAYRVFHYIETAMATVVNDMLTAVRRREQVNNRLAVT